MKFIVTIDAVAWADVEFEDIPTTAQVKAAVEDALDNAGFETFATVEPVKE